MEPRKQSKLSFVQVRGRGRVVFLSAKGEEISRLTYWVNDLKPVRETEINKYQQQKMKSD